MQSAGTKKPKGTSKKELDAAATLKARVITSRKNKTPLEKYLNEQRILWLARHCSRRWDSYYASLSGWREKLEHYQQESEDCFQWRLGKPTQRNEGSESIFDRQNDSINLVGAFSEFFQAQCVNDLFGGEPWLAANPEGKKNDKLAEDLSRHLDWKLRKAGVREAYREAVKLTADLGTCFIKTIWCVETDTWFEDSHALHQQGKPVLTSSGEHIFQDDAITEEPDEVTGEIAARYPEKDPTTLLQGDGFEYKPVREKKARNLYENVKVFNLHFRDVAFDATAPELSLFKTGFYHRFSRNLLDVVRDYKISEEDAYRLFNTVTRDHRTEAEKRQDYRGEKDASYITDDTENGQLPNIPITLVEGYDRLDVLGEGVPSCVYVVFCPELELVLHVDFLQNVTPDGMLPVHAHTMNRIPHRIVGRGYFEKLAEVQRQVDQLYNRIVYHDRKSAVPITGLDTSILEMEDEEDEFEYNPDKPLNLKPGGKIDEAVQFKTLPDMSNRTVAMMQTVIQMVQLRTGITSASQGDVAGVPEANTATGVKQLVTRAAIMLKNGIGDLAMSFTSSLTYGAKVIYSNQDTDETFLYGEGENAELVELKADDIQNLDVVVRLLLSQTQNQSKLEHAQAAMNIVLSYVGLPEQEKEAARPLFVQAIRALEFTDPESIIRQPALQIGDVIAMLPPDQQAMAAQLIATGAQAMGVPPPPLPPPPQQDAPQSASGSPSPLPQQQAA